MARAGNIYLIGPMGSGKTAVGRELARRLGRPFIDTDEWIERKTRASVPELFARQGEAFFRRWERRAVRDAARRAGTVVALGGGAPAIGEVRELIRATGITVRLTCDQGALWKRLADKAGGRPMLAAGTQAESRRRLAELLRKRERVFPRGDLRVSTTDLSVKKTAREIEKRLRKW